MVSLRTTRSGARAAARAAGAAAPAPRVDWKGASSAHSYDPFGRHVAERPTHKEERHAHFVNAKYFKSAPQHSYVHQWTPTINEQTGQDNEVDPYDRIAKRGHYTEMLRNWEPYYNIDNLLCSKGAPTEMLRVAQDLSRHGVRLGDSAAAKLLWSVVNKVEGLVKQQQGEQVLLGPGGERSAAVAGMSLSTLRNALMNAKLLIDEIRSGHTVGLETGAALALLHGMGGGAAMAEDLEVELRHLLEDPETPLLNKKNFYEAMALVPVLDWSGADKGAAEIAARRSFHWLGRMKALRIRPGSDFFKNLLYQFVRRGDVTRALEVKKNMMDPDGFLVEPRAPHYFQLLVGLAQAGEVEMFTKMQLEMKQHSLPYSTQAIWGLFMHAVANKGDVPHLLSTYRTLKSGVKILMSDPRFRNRRKKKLRQTPSKLKVRATAGIVLSVLQGMRSQGMIEEMHSFWREETLTVTGWAYRTAAITRRMNAGFTEPVLIELCTALAQAKRYDLLADVYDVAYPKTLSVSVWEKKNDPFYLDLKLGIPRNRGRIRHEADVRNGRIWHCMSVGLAMVGRMEESHFVASKLMGVKDTRTFGVEHHMHLLEGALLLPKQEEKEYFIGITLKALEDRRYPLNGDAYALVMACFLDGSDTGSALRVLSEMTAQAAFPAPEKAAQLLQRLPDAATAERRVLLEGLWSAARSSKAAAQRPLPHPVVSLFAERHPRLPGLSDALLHSIEAFENFRPDPAGLRYVGRRPRLLVADGTVAVSLLDADVDGDVMVPQSVLSQLQAALHRSDASEKEQAFFRTSLYAFRQFVDAAATGPEEEGVRAAAQVVTHEGENAAGVDHRHATPQRIVELVKVLAAASAEREVAVLTNDTEMAAFCRSRGVEVQLLNRASQEYLPSPDDVPELPATASSLLLPLSDTDEI